MKKIKAILLVAVVAFTMSFNANAQLRFGLKAGLTVNSLHFNSETFDASNRAGFTGGAMIEFTVPIVGLGFDLSAMYVRRNAEWMTEHNLTKDDRDYIDVPLNLKWKIGLPGVGRIITPYIFTGPTFSFLTSKQAVEAAWKNRKFDTSWNIGFGAELVRHLQISASYSLGMTKTLEFAGLTSSSDEKIHNRYWTITAAYLF